MRMGWLNAWQRAGIVATLAWLAVVGPLAYTLTSEEALRYAQSLFPLCTEGQTECLRQMSVNYRSDMEYVWRLVLFWTALPVLLGWFLGYGIAWVRAARRPR
jgi:hypothetical protein